MSNKLEAMVDLLAGRKVEAGLLEELDDPSSEASRFLEATRIRSRALLDEPSPRERPDGEGRGDRRWLIVLAVVATGLLTATGLAYWASETRLRRLERDLAGSREDARSSGLRLEAALNRLAEAKPPVGSLDPVEAGLKTLDRRLEGLERRAEEAKSDPTLGVIRDELVLLRRELSANEKGVVRGLEELQASIHEVARLLRLLINQAQPPAIPDRQPVFPPPRPPSGVENRRVTP